MSFTYFSLLPWLFQRLPTALWHNCTADGAQVTRQARTTSIAPDRYKFHGGDVCVGGGNTFLVCELWGTLLTESSCVCWLREVFWHFPVDIESKGEKKKTWRKGNQKKEKGKWEERKRSFKKSAEKISTFFTHKAAQVMTEEWWNVSFRPQSKHTDGSVLTFSGGLQIYSYWIEFKGGSCDPLVKYLFLNILIAQLRNLE